MKNSKEHAKVFAAQLRKLKKRSDPQEMTDPVEVLVYSQLLWESTTTHANEAWGRLQDDIEDWNDLRVSMPDEIVSMSGDKSDLAIERAMRLKAVLNHVYRRHHDVTFGPELEMGKRDVREAIESLDGMSPFLSARWLMLCVDVAGVPVDDQLRWLLADAGCVEEDASLDEVASWVGRQVKADQSLDVHARLQAWVDARSDSVAAKRDKQSKSSARDARKVRTASVKARATAREEAAKRKIEAARRAAAKKAAAELAAAERAAAAAQRAVNKAAKDKVIKKKVSKKPAGKTASKATSGRKPAGKKVATKKAASKKPAAKKPASKKAASKKTASRKTASKKPVPKKKVTRKKPARRKTTAKARGR